MRREVFLHLAFLVSFFVLVSVFRGWLALSYWPFWLGGMLGAFLPDVDHLIYVYFLRPEELTSKRADFTLKRGSLRDTAQLLADTRTERETLVFHTIVFQVVFLLLTFLVVTSSGNIFGMGLVLAFSLHFLVDQLVDMGEGTWKRWLHRLPFDLDKSQFKTYWWIILALVSLFGFFM